MKRNEFEVKSKHVEHPHDAVLTDQVSFQSFELISRHNLQIGARLTDPQNIFRDLNQDLNPEAVSISDVSGVRVFF